MTESNMSLLCLCDPPREGFSKASVSLVKPFSQGLCKVCMPESNLCVALFVRLSKERHQQGFGLSAQTFFSMLCKGLYA